VLGVIELHQPREFPRYALPSTQSLVELGSRPLLFRAEHRLSVNTRIFGRRSGAERKLGRGERKLEDLSGLSEEDMKTLRRLAAKSLMEGGVV
jgi:hypothetical protein